jgi:hypothetical protein
VGTGVLGRLVRVATHGTFAGISRNAALWQLTTVAAYLAGHHAGDTGPGGSSKGPCAIAGMFGCAAAAASVEYGSVHPRTGFCGLFSVQRNSVGTRSLHSS